MAPAAVMLTSSLPVEIQAEILLKLPAKSILICKCVCKLWFNLISSPNFINDHLRLSIKNKDNHKFMFTDKESGTGKPLMYSVDYNSITSTPDLSCDYIGDKAVLMDTPFEYKEGMKVRILGACHGLFCFGILYDEETSICIWNPTTREYKEIQNCDFHSKLVVGFGYDSKTGDYKMVRIGDSKKSDYCEVEVYACGRHLSKTIHTFNYKFPPGVAFSGVFLNGALHWINNMAKQDISDRIVSFDISNEKLADVPLPEKSVILTEGSNSKVYKKVGVFEHCLSLVLVDLTLFQTEMWVMQDYGVRKSWTILFTGTQFINYGFSCIPMPPLKNGEILMYNCRGFLLYDPKNERAGRVSSFSQENTPKARCFTMMTAHPESYVESLVPLYSIGYLCEEA